MKCKGIFDGSIKPPPTINNMLNPLLGYGNKLKLKFNGSCLKHDKTMYNHGEIVNIYTVYEIDNRKKDVLILGKGPVQGLEYKLSAEKIYSISFTENKKNCLSLHYNGAKSYLFVNGKEIHKFKAKDSEVVPNIFCLGYISNDFSADNMKQKQD